MFYKILFIFQLKIKDYLKVITFLWHLSILHKNDWIFGLTAYFLTVICFSMHYWSLNRKTTDIRRPFSETIWRGSGVCLCVSGEFVERRPSQQLTWIKAHSRLLILTLPLCLRANKLTFLCSFLSRPIVCFFLHLHVRLL